MSRPTNRKHQRARSETGIVLMVGDGLSEKNYFDKMSDILRTKGITTMALSECGLEKILKSAISTAQHHGIDPKKGDMVAIVTDLDDRYSREQIIKMQRDCEANGIKFFLSNPSFEVWLLCHYRRPTRPYSQTELEEDLERELGRKYVKSEGIDLDDKKIDRAITNARKLLPQDSCNPIDCFEHNPSTTVHSFVESIRKFFKKK